MRISDWSSDVCSSDLHDARGTIGTGEEERGEIALGALLVLAQKRVQIAGHACRLGDTGLDAARVHVGDADRRTLHLQFLAQAFIEAAHGDIAGVVAAVARHSKKAEQARSADGDRKGARLNSS